jgi:O-antigen/teichoic acid export membrane protein
VSLLDEIIRPGIWILLGTALVNVANLLYQIGMVRFLSPVQYGELNALMAFLLVITVPAGTAQTTVSQTVSQQLAQKDLSGVRLFVRKMLATFGLLGMIGFLIVILFRHSIAGFLQLDDPSLILPWGWAAFFLLIAPVVLGALQGLQQFFSFGANTALGGLLKLLLGISAVALGLGVLGAMNAFWLGSLLTLAVGLVQLRGALRRMRPVPEEQQEKSWLLFFSGWMEEAVAVLKTSWRVPHYTAWAAAGIFSYTCLTNFDVVLAKHYLLPQQAGYYAISAMIARMVLFLPSAFSIIFFPKVAYAAARGEPTRPLLTKILIVTALLSGSGAALLVFWPQLGLRLLAGTVHEACIPLVRILAAGMLGMALANVGLVYLLGVQKVKKIVPYLIGAAAQLIGIVLFHDSALFVACVTSSVAWLLACYALWVARRG